jgi:DNA-entry nuclease
MKKLIITIFTAVSMVLCLSGCSSAEQTTSIQSVSVEDIPAYTNSPYVVINENVPDFDLSKEKDSYQIYSELDDLGRTLGAEACLSKDMMPTEERNSISSILPSGWHSIQDDSIPGGSLYNRCHLIAYQLTGVNDERNLITGTRYLNVEGMLPFEEMVADYIRETDNHVLYRVTPYYEVDNLVASGVFMEAYSLEDKGDGICFHVYCYNVMPSVEIDYKTGDAVIENSNIDTQTQKDYILNIKSKKIHLPECNGVQTMSDKNKKEVHASIDELQQEGYSICSNCIH